MKKKQPNIVMFFSDQQRWDSLGCYGQKLDVTPCLDRLAKEGVKFSHAYTPQPVCGPARAMLQTGKYPTELGCFRNNIALPKNTKTIANYLEEVGYNVGYVGKWHLASDGEQEKPNHPSKDFHNKGIPLELRGGYNGYWKAADLLEFTSHGYGGYVFDEQCQRVDFEGYRVDAMTDFALEYIEQQTGEQPFFLFLSQIEPHHQNDRCHYEGPKGSKETFKNFDVPIDLQGLNGDYMEEMPDYLGCCNSLDKNVERLIQKLKEKGVYEDTIFIYTSDHGSHFRTRNQELEEGNYDDYKRSCHDGCTHIPLIIHGPGYDTGKEINALVSLIDIPKTILGMAGIDVGSMMQGEDLHGLVTGKKKCLHDEIFMQISESQVGRAIRTKKWKYAVKAPGLKGGMHAGSMYYEEAYLYNLEQDPGEHNNLVCDPSYKKIRGELAVRLKKSMNSANEEVPDIVCMCNPVHIKEDEAIF